MADLVIVDTDVLIDVGRGESDAIACLRSIEQHSSLAASVVTQMELITGCRNKIELRKLERFLLRFHLIRLNEQISDSAVNFLQRYRLSHGLLVADALIAASAKVLDIALVTKNQRDYRFIEGIKLLSYPQPFPA